MDTSFIFISCLKLLCHVTAHSYTHARFPFGAGYVVLAMGSDFFTTANLQNTFGIT